MEDSQHLCPDCGANYVEAVVDDIASGAGADSRLMLASLEEGLAGLDAVPLPALGDTARKMLPALCAAALVFCLLAGVATGANIFYLLAAVALVPLAVSLLARMQGKLRLSAGEVVVRAAARVFAEDAASVRERFAGDAEVLARLDAMQLRLDDALARQASAPMRRSPSGSGCATATPTRPGTTNMRAKTCGSPSCVPCSPTGRALRPRIFSSPIARARSGMPIAPC